MKVPSQISPVPLLLTLVNSTIISSSFSEQKPWSFQIIKSCLTFYLFSPFPPLSLFFELVLFQTWTVTKSCNWSICICSDQAPIHSQCSRNELSYSKCTGVIAYSIEFRIKTKFLNVSIWACFVSVMLP